MEIVPFERAHVDAAARLVGRRVHAVRGSVPLVSPALEAPDAWREPLERALVAVERDRDRGMDREAAVAAVDGGGLVGFLVAALDAEAGRAYCPDWANAVEPGGRRVLEALYARAAARWVAAGIRAHVVGSLEGFPDERAAWSWLGFGRIVIDAVRDLAPLADGARRTSVDRRDGSGSGPALGSATSAPAGFSVRPATPADLDRLIAMDDGLRAHLLASPVFLALPAAPAHEARAARLLEAGGAAFVADDGASPIAYLRVGPHAGDVTRLLQDDDTAAITAAFTEPAWRGTGVAAALVDAALGWARARGYARCGVDFESANLEGSRFWTEHFRPVSVAFLRRLGPDAGRVPG